jgi:hypothetical protein
MPLCQLNINRFFTCSKPFGSSLTSCDSLRKMNYGVYRDGYLTKSQTIAKIHAQVKALKPSTHHTSMV